MKKWNRLAAGILVAALGAGLLTGCGSDASTASAASAGKEAESADTSGAAAAPEADKAEAPAEAVTIRVADFHNAIWNAQFIVAYQSGIFDEVFAGDNVTLDVATFANGPAVNEAFIAGEVDIVNGIGDQPIIAGAANGVGTRVLALVAKQEKNIGIVAKADSGIVKPEDLRGKRIGVYIGTYVHKSLIGILGDYGISADDAEIVNIATISDADAAFATGDIDAYLSMNAEYVNKNVASGEFVEVTDLTGHPAYSYIVASNDFVTRYPEVTQKFLNALQKGQELIDADREKAYELIVQYSEFEPDFVKGTLDQAGIEFDLSEDSVQNLHATYDFMHDFEMISTELTSEEIDAHIDRTFIDAVAK